MKGSGVVGGQVFEPFGPPIVQKDHCKIFLKNIEGIFLNFVGRKTGLVLTDWRGVLNKFAQN